MPVLHIIRYDEGDGSEEHDRNWAVCQMKIFGEDMARESLFGQIGHLAAQAVILPLWVIRELYNVFKDN